MAEVAASNNNNDVYNTSSGLSTPTSVEEEEEDNLPKNNEMVAVVNPNIVMSNLHGLTPNEMTNILENTLPENGDPTKLQLAYGIRAVPKLVSESTNKRLKKRQHALINLCDLFHNPENIANGIKESIVPKLTVLILEKDLTIRQKATECLKIISGYSLGRNTLIKCGTMKTLSQLFDDEDALVRLNTHIIFSRVTIQKSGVDSILIWGVIKLLITKLIQERIDIQCFILDTLYNCIRKGSAPWIPNEPLENEAMKIFTILLSGDKVSQVKVGASKCIMMLSFYPDGKTRAVNEVDTITSLIDNLSDLKSSVRAASAGALMSISIDVEGKRALVRDNAIPKLIHLLDNDKNPSVLLNVIKTIANCSEDYRGRFQLHTCIKQLEIFGEGGSGSGGIQYKSNDEQSVLAEAANKAIKVITWRP